VRGCEPCFGHRRLQIVGLTERDPGGEGRATQRRLSVARRVVGLQEAWPESAGRETRQPFAPQWPADRPVGLLGEEGRDFIVERKGCRAGRVSC
jgi:hypothetical protein